MEKILQNIKQLTQVAIEDAEKAFGIHLDYSHKSIEEIEKILSSYHEKFQAGTLTDQMAQIIGTGNGCYVGETLIKQLGFGEWIAPTEGPTAGEWVLDIKGTHCLFPSKAIRRIKNGPEDTVVTMYQMAFNNNSDEKNSKIYKNPAATDAYLDKVALAMVEQLNKKVTTEPADLEQDGIRGTCPDNL